MRRGTEISLANIQPGGMNNNLNFSKSVVAHEKVMDESSDEGDEYIRKAEPLEEH